MRLAFSAMTATSGLVLLGLAVYGDPTMYMQRVRQEWDALTAPPAPQTLSVAQADPDADAIERLQRQVAALQQQLARQSVSDTKPPAASAPPSSATSLSGNNVAATPQPATPVVSEPPPPAATPAPLPRIVDTGTTPSVSPAVPPVMTTPPPTIASGPIPEQRVTAATKDTLPPLPEPPEASGGEDAMSRAEAARADAARGGPRTADRSGGKAIPGKAAQPRSPMRLHADSEDTQSVLARLRQSSVSPPPEVLSVPAETEAAPPPPPPPSPALPRLSAARSALQAGHIDDAVRLLQEAQLKLVFRPVDALGPEPEVTGQSASDVARALEALSANNRPAAQRLIERAIGALRGVATNVPAGFAGVTSTGYAPAYPPR